VVSEEHPRYSSLTIRDKLVEGYKQGIVSTHGLIAHGRGEAFDYLLGEKTNEIALNASKVACAFLLTAKRPVLSVNGNTAALAAKEIAEFNVITRIPVEINLFHRSRERIETIAHHLQSHGVENILMGLDFIEVQDIASQRAKVDKRGIYQADTVLAPLEDGDRAQALTQLGKIVLTVDLNPLSRTALTSTVTIVDELTRAMKNLVALAKYFKTTDDLNELTMLKTSFDNRENLEASYKIMLERLQSLIS